MTRVMIQGASRRAGRRPGRLPAAAAVTVSGEPAADQAITCDFPGMMY